MSSFEGIAIDKFDGTDFDYWKMQIKDYLRFMGREFHLPLNGKPESMKEEDWRILDKKVLGIVRLTLSRNVFDHVANEKTTIGLMKTLSDIYEKPYLNKLYLVRKLIDLKMAEGVPFVEHLNEFNRIINKLSSVKLEFNKEVTAILLLNSLPDSWERMKIALPLSLGTRKLKIEDIIEAAFAEEICRKHFGVTSTPNSSFKVGGREKSINNEPYEGKGNKGRGKDKQKIECYYCHKLGHIKANCRKLKNEQKDNS